MTTTWAERLHSARIAADLSQQDAAELLGVSQSTISRWEWGEVEPGVTRAAELLALLEAARTTKELRR